MNDDFIKNLTPEEINRLMKGDVKDILEATKFLERFLEHLENSGTKKFLFQVLRLRSLSVQSTLSFLEQLNTIVKSYSLLVTEQVKPFRDVSSMPLP